MTHVKIAWLAFSDRDGVATELALTGCRKQSLDSWLTQSSQFYINALANEHILAGLAHTALPAHAGKSDGPGCSSECAAKEAKGRSEVGD